MEVKKTKSARFDALVKTSGRPDQVTLWTTPEEDPEFMKAVNSKRVVTVFQANVGTKKDFGVVGFFAEKNATFLVFPKPLTTPAETKVVGIKYDQVASQSPKGPLFKARKPQRPGIKMRERPRFKLATEKQAKEEEPFLGSKSPRTAKEKALPRFLGRVQLAATQMIAIELEAKNRKEAEKLIKARAAQLSLDPTSAQIKRTIKGVKKVRAK